MTLTTTPLRILVVDDHPNTASMLARALGQFPVPVQVLTARGGQEALDLACQSPVDVLITDFMMSGLNGLELVEKLQQARQEPGYVILITAYDSPGLGATARRLKVNEYLVKPVQPEKVRALVGRVVEGLHAAQARTAATPALSETTILIADDRPDNVRLLTTRLESDGYRFIAAEDGEAALTQARTHLPDLILLDVDMPKKDGFAVLTEMRRDPQLAHIPVIILTAARTTPRDVREGLGLGADDYMTKPFDWRELAARIRSKLRVKQAEDALRRRNRELSLLPDIGQDLSARFDVDELTAVTLERTVQALGAEDGHLVIFGPEGQGLHHFFKPRDLAPWTEAEAHKRLEVEGIVPRVVGSRSGAVVPDIQAESDWLALPHDPSRSAIAVPLLSRTGVLGVLTLLHAQPGRFGSEQLSLLQAIAGQSAIAIENAKFYAVERRRAAELAALNQIGRRLSVLTHSTELFDTITSLVRETLEFPVVSFWLMPEGVPALRNVSGEVPGLRPSVMALGARQVAVTGEPVLLAGAVEERAQARPGGGMPPVHSTVAVPIIWDARVSGVLAIHSPHPHAFGARDREILENVASQMATALERLRLFESVEREERRLKAVLNGAADAILVLDADDRLELANPAAVRMFTDVETRLGQPLPADRGYDTLLTLLRAARQTDGAGQGEVAWPDGRTFVAVVDRVDEAGLVAILHDVTYFKDLERVKNEFIATASHDLKNPLTSVMGYTELVQRVAPLTAQQTEFMGRIRQAAQHMHELVLDLLEMARLDMGGELNLERVDLGVLLTGVVDDFRPQAEAKQQTLEFTLPVGLPTVSADAKALAQAVRNLLGNAVKYTPQGGRLAVVVEASPAAARVIVKDSGIGIPPADLPHIFDKFYRVQSEATSQIEGNGLGLSIVRTIIEKHQGRVTVDSTVGQGSTFVVTLPAARLSGGASAAQPAVAVPAAVA